MASTIMASADTQQLQMLPPTYFGTGSNCIADGSFLIYGGTSSRDSQSGTQSSAINCMNTGLSVNTSNGDVWIGSKDFSK
jgi:hypothetical protein